MVSVAYSTDFEKLWKGCPPAMRKDKGYAFKSFQKLKCVNGDVEMILTSIRRHEHTKSWCNGYVPHLSTYLNQRRFEDEIGEDEISNAFEGQA